MRSSHTFHADSAKFDDDPLVPCAGLLPVMTLADQTGLTELLANKVAITAPTITSGAANLAPKLTTLIAAMCAGADSIDDIDSLLRPVYGHAKQGASYGHSKIAGKQILRKGLPPLATIISTADSAPVITGMRLRAGKAGSGTGAARMVAQAITTARMAGATGKITVRGDSACGNSRVVRTCINARVEFSFVLIKNRLVQRAIDSIADDAWTPVRYPGAVRDPGNWTPGL